MFKQQKCVTIRKQHYTYLKFYLPRKLHLDKHILEERSIPSKSNSMHNTIKTLDRSKHIGNEKQNLHISAFLLSIKLFLISFFCR